MGGKQSKAKRPDPIPYPKPKISPGSRPSVPKYPPGMPFYPGPIIDHYTSLEEVTEALRQSGLESSNLIVGIDFTKSNEWTGKNSFNGRSLHAISNIPNPYEQAISIIGRTLSPFDEDNLIPCFGFGDITTHDQQVFSFHQDNRPCNGFEEALARYKEIVPHIRLAGPTSFAPVIEVAIDIVIQSGCQYHVLLIIADGQVTRSIDTDSDMLSPQEQSTVDAIVAASEYPLSIVLVGVGDGPWDLMQNFDDNIPERSFDNFQFVNFTDIMSRNRSREQREAAFALAALMEIPFQYQAALTLKLLNRTTNRRPKSYPLPTPAPVAPRSLQMPQENTASVSSQSDLQLCPVCWTNPKNMAFNCGHQTCADCGNDLSTCPICRIKVQLRLRLF